MEDYRQNQLNSAYCRYVEVLDEFYGGLNAAVRIPRQIFCPPPENEPPEVETLPGGGEACRLYNVLVQVDSIDSGSTTFLVENVPGPVRLQRYRREDNGPRFVGNDNVMGGDGINCPIQRTQTSGFDDFRPNVVTSTILSVTPVDGLPDTAPPFPVPTDPRDSVPPPDLNFPVTVNLGGQEVNVDLQFQMPVTIPIGVVIPVFAPVSPSFEFNFNPNITGGPRVGIDLNLDFAVNLPPSGDGNQPPASEPPVQLPPANPPGNGDCEEFDYERIEDAITAARCCNPITNVVNVGTFTFETTTQVAEFNVPENAVAVFIGIVPSDNARVFKFAGADSEYGHGNASLTSRGNTLSFERLYVNNHVLFYPETADSKGVRISCGKGTIVNVSAGVYVPEE